MTDAGQATEHLIERLRLRDDQFWSILGELAGTSEEERCRILRPSLEASPAQAQYNDLISQRRRLNDVLNVLTLLEVGFQTCVVQSMEMPKNTQGAFRSLVSDSEAFLLYVDAYLYFGVRLFAGRLFGVRPAENAELYSAHSHNVLSFPLCVPADLTEQKNNA